MSSVASDDEDMGLDGMMPEPERPPSPEPTYATYELPTDLETPVASTSKSVDIRLVGSHPLWGHHLWNAARTFSTYLLRNPEFTKDLRILELGAGGALPSIVSAIGGAQKVVVTDYPDQPLIDNMQHNVDINLSEEQRRRIVCAGHTWGKPVEPLLAELGGDNSKFDIILLSDLVFNHSQHSALIKTCHNALSTTLPSASRRTPCLLIFYTHHRPHLADKDRAFLDTLSFYDPDASSDDEGEPSDEHDGGWAYEKVVEEWTGPMFEDDPGDAQVRGTVWGWRCWRVGPGETRGEIQSK